MFSIAKNKVVEKLSSIGKYEITEPQHGAISNMFAHAIKEAIKKLSFNHGLIAHSQWGGKGQINTNKRSKPKQVAKRPSPRRSPPPKSGSTGSGFFRL